MSVGIDLSADVLRIARCKSDIQEFEDYYGVIGITPRWNEPIIWNDAQAIRSSSLSKNISLTEAWYQFNRDHNAKIELCSSTKHDAEQVLASELLVDALKVYLDEHLNDQIIISIDNNLSEFQHTGDELLVALANTLNEVFNEGTIFRWGGDEFIVLLTNNTIDPNEFVKEFHKKISEVTIQEIELSASIGFAVDSFKNEEVYDLINKAEVMMYKNKSLESLSVKRKVIDDLLQTLYKSFEFEEEHSKSVMKYAILLGEQLNQNKDQLDRLRLAALLHDIGKVGIPAEIVDKKSTLSKAEMETIKNHPEKGLRILSAYPELSEFGNYSLTHHENYDGSGYPRGLKEETIPLFSRIISIAETYAVMTSQRTYKDGVSKAEAIKELVRNKGTQFDPELVDAFIKALEKE